MRTALRDADSPVEVTVLGPDIALGNWLTGVFPGSKLYAHETAADCKAVLGDADKARGRPRKASALSPAERAARSYEKQKQIILTKNSIYKVFFVRTQVALSHEPSVNSLCVEQSNAIDWADVRVQLRQCLDEIQTKKEDNTLVSGALFDESKCGDTSKGLANIELVNGVWLDFDGGALMPDEFERMFRDVRWWMWNSFNNGKDSKTKFRVLFPTQSPMTAVMYHAVWDAIAARIRDFGYYVGTDIAYDKAVKSGRAMPNKSGLDASKRTANSFFYLPCRAGLGLKQTFWRENWADGVPMLEPELWITYAPLEPQQYEVKAAYLNPATPLLERARERLAREQQHRGDDADHADRDAARAAGQVAARDAAIAQWRSAPPGTGNAAFYRLAFRLKSASMNDYEVRATLEQEAAFGQSPAERRAQIPSILASLRRFVPTTRAA